MSGRRSARRYPSGRNERNEPFEVFTRPQRSVPARVAGLALRLRAEITTGTAGLWTWSTLTAHMPTWAAVLIVVAVGSAVAGWGPSRRFVSRRGMAVVTRHRLRKSFIERRVMNFTGNLPLLLWSRPTPVGERVWVFLRAGIAGVDIEHNLDHIAAGCFARDARVSVTRRMTALVCVDVIRRDPLAGSSPVPTPGPQPQPNGRPALHVVPDQKGA